MIEPPPAARRCGQAGDGVAVVADEVGLEHRVPRLVGRSPTARASWRTPALATSASRPPSFATAALTEARTAAPSRASARTKSAPVRAATSRPASLVAAGASRPRPPRIGTARRSTRRCPEVPPVTSARIPSQSRHRRDPPTSRPGSCPHRRQIASQLGYIIRMSHLHASLRGRNCAKSQAASRFSEHGSRKSEGGEAHGGSHQRPGVSPPEGARGRLTGSTELARNALGLPQILFCIVTGSAPLAAMMFNDPLSGSGDRHLGTRGVLVGRGSRSRLFSVGYVEMARRKTTAGGFYSYTSYGFGRIIGLGTAIGIVGAYLLFAVGVNGVTTYFANTSIKDLFGLQHGLADLLRDLHPAPVHGHLLPRGDRRPDPRASPSWASW